MKKFVHALAVPLFALALVGCEEPAEEVVEEGGAVPPTVAESPDVEVVEPEVVVPEGEAVTE